ncbi:MAG: hypothetical protein ACK595_05760, partial [Planctomycetota bacterium]
MTLRTLLAAALAVLSATLAPAQQGKPAPPAPAAADGKLAEWPALLAHGQTPWPPMGPVVAEAAAPARSQERAPPGFEASAPTGAVAQ